MLTVLHSAHVAAQKPETQRETFTPDVAPASGKSAASTDAASESSGDSAEDPTAGASPQVLHITLD